MFNAQEFLDATIAASNSTHTVPCPIGEYTGVIEKVLPRQWQTQDGTQSGIALDVLWLIEDENVKALLDRDTVIVKQGIMLDLLPTGGLDLGVGKNVGLGRLREAVGKNEEGQQFSFSMLPGLAAKVSVKHRVVGEDTFGEVKGVAKL